MPAVPYRLTGDGLALTVRVTPNAGVDRIEGAEQRDDGQIALRLRVAAVPDKGRANAAVVALLSKALGVPKTRIRVISGETARLKVLAVTGDAPTLATKLDALL